MSQESQPPPLEPSQPSSMPPGEAGVRPEDFRPAGVPQPGRTAYAPTPSRTSAWAIVSLISGVLGCVPFATGIIAIVTGIVGLKKANAGHGGRGLAIGGIVLGSLSLVFWAFFGSVFVSIFSATAEPRRIAQEFSRDVNNGAIDSAMDRVAPTVEREQVIRLSEQMDAWGELQDVTSTKNNINVQGGVSTCELGGTATFSDGDHTFDMVLLRVGEAWKVSAFEFE